MPSKNIYSLNDTDYSRRILNLKEDYAAQGATYLSIVNSTPYPDELAKLTTQMESFTDESPEVSYFRRDPITLDRHLEKAKLSDYIADIKQTNRILAPSLTTYMSPKISVSFLSEFTRKNVEARSIIKKKMFQEKDAVKKLLYGRQQVNKKGDNNRVTGILGIGGTTISNKSGHSTLTSTTRAITSMANALNERFLSGTRHYRSEDLCINSMVYTIHTMLGTPEARNNFQQTLEHYKLVTPSLHDTSEYIWQSASIYMYPQKKQNLYEFISKLSDIERCAVMYTGDFYAVRKFNPDMVKTFVSELITLKQGEYFDGIIDKIWEQNDIVLSFVHHRLYPELEEKAKRYGEMDKALVASIYHTCVHIESVLRKWEPLIMGLFVNSVLPPSVAYMRDMIRRVVGMSDTDSTLRAAGEWIQWYNNDYSRFPSRNAVNVAVGSSILMLSEFIANHHYKQYNVNIAGDTDRITEIEMKDELTLHSFIVGTQTKHYAGLINIQEGNVFKRDKKHLEMKGVNLKNSNAPEIVNKALKEIVLYVTTGIEDGKDLYFKHIYDIVVHIENTISKSIMDGKADYLRFVLIKDPSSYKKPDPKDNIYQHKILWDNTYGKLLGQVYDVPYVVARVPITLNNKTQVKAFVASLDNSILRDGFDDFFLQFNKTAFPKINLPRDYIIGHGIPKELQPYLDLKLILLNLCNPLYTMLDYIGYHLPTGHTLTQE